MSVTCDYHGDHFHDDVDSVGDDDDVEDGGDNAEDGDDDDDLDNDNDFAIRHLGEMKFKQKGREEQCEPDNPTQAKKVRG